MEPSRTKQNSIFFSYKESAVDVTAGQQEKPDRSL